MSNQHWTEYALARTLQKTMFQYIVSFFFVMLHSKSDQLLIVSQKVFLGNGESTS